MPPRRHLFVCTNTRGSGKPTCGTRGGDAILAEVQRALLAAGASGTAVATACACLGPCFDGPNAVVYPDGVWYGGLAPEDAPAIAQHLLGGPLLAGKIITPGDD
jgi:(2Fe-2S) ferredoxin